MAPITRVLAAALTLSTPVSAQVMSIESNIPIQRGHDPNRLVCEIDQTTGTRLGARKVCKTVAEWDDLRREHRDTIDQLQQMSTSACHDGRSMCGPH